MAVVKKNYFLKTEKAENAFKLKAKRIKEISVFETSVFYIRHRQKNILTKSKN